MLKKTICLILSILFLNLTASAAAEPANDNADLDKQIKAIIKTLYLPKNQITFDLYWRNGYTLSEKVYKLDKDAVRIKYYEKGAPSKSPTNATFRRNKTIMSYSFTCYDDKLLPSLNRISNGASLVNELVTANHYAIIDLDNGKHDVIDLCEMFNEGGTTNPHLKMISSGQNDNRLYGLPEAEEEQHVLLRIEKSLLSKKVKDQLVKSNLDLTKTKGLLLNHMMPFYNNQPILLYDGKTEYMLTIRGEHYVQGFSYPLENTTKKDFREFTFESDRLYDFRKEILPLYIHEVEVFKWSGYDY